MEWFKCIDEFNENEENACNYDGSVLIKLDAAKDKDELETYLGSASEDASTGERKGMKKNIVRYVSEVDDSLMQIVTESFYNTTKECKDETTSSSIALWRKARKDCFINDDGKAVHTRLRKNKNTQWINAVIPFGYYGM